MPSWSAALANVPVFFVVSGWALGSDLHEVAMRAGLIGSRGKLARRIWQPRLLKRASQHGIRMDPDRYSGEFANAWHFV